MQRRDFLKQSTAATLLGATALHASGQAQASGAKDVSSSRGGGTYSLPGRFAEDLKAFSPTVAVVGCGWYGMTDVSRMMQVAPVNVVAVCDVDQKALNQAADAVAERQFNQTRPKTFADHRQMLQETKPEIVVVGTPDHWHALVAIDAMQAGCHVYCQKPISVDIAEGQAMLAAAEKHQRLVQVGLQRRSTPHLVDAKKQVVDAGKLGTIAHVDMFCYHHMRASVPPKTYPVPETLDWDRYCGPAPLQPYHPVMHPRGWRSWQAFGNGITGDMGIHMLDTARWMLGLGWPKSVTAQGGILVDMASMADVPDTQMASFDFESLTMTWQLRTWGNAMDPEVPWGCVIHGDKGSLAFDLWKAVFTPQNRREEPQRFDVLYEQEQYPEERPERYLETHATPATRRHHQNFLRAILGTEALVAPLEEGHKSTACCILANNAMTLGQTIVWDGEKPVGDNVAQGMMQRAYRAPWVHPASV